ncbi:MAG: hypothetical protein KDC34_06300 [Saprospiraceae bacterium]|nr:hypothetical protein [Saprospiraceae bacterium]
MKIKIILAGSMLLLATVTALGQPRPEAEGRIRSMHAAYISDRLRLTPEESQVFWPIYNEFQEKEQAIKDSYRPAKGLGTLNESEANELINNHLQMEQEVLNLKKDYLTRLKKVVPAKKLVMLTEAEREFKEKLIEEIQQRRQDRMQDRKHE